MMAQTVAYVQEHGFQSKADLDAALSDASAQSTDARNTLKIHREYFEECQ